MILASGRHDPWLDPSIQDADTALNSLRQLVSTLMRRYQVSTRVNVVASDDPECSVPVELPAVPATLFD